jgi:hypothetical protein
LAAQKQNKKKHRPSNTPDNTHNPLTLNTLQVIIFYQPHRRPTSTRAENGRCNNKTIRNSLTHKKTASRILNREFRTNKQ